MSEMSLPDAEETLEPVSEPEVVNPQSGHSRRSRKRNILIFCVVTVLNVALLALLWSQLMTPASSQTGLKFSNVSAGYVESPLLGKPAPDFTLPALSTKGGGSSLHLAALKGKSAILNFWASWCDPCKEEAPFLSKTWERLQAQGIVMVGIDGQETRDAALKFMLKYGITYQNVQDDLNGSTAIGYGVTGFPETIFINRDGVVVAKFTGPLNEKSLQVGLEQLQR